MSQLILSVHSGAHDAGAALFEDYRVRLDARNRATDQGARRNKTMKQVLRRTSTDDKDE